GPMHLSFMLERAVGEAPPGEDEAPLALLSTPDHVDALGGIREVATSVDADFDPTAWLEARLLAGEAEIALLPEGAGFAVLPRCEAGTLLASMLIAVAGLPHAG